MIAMRYLIPVILTSFTAMAAPISFRSSERQEALVELYTSEGCSSCPPAETWLSGLKEKTGLWSEFVPVAFHVDYWNNLGWPDKFSSKAYSDRQRDYAGEWGSANIYTPEFVLNGKEWHYWFGLKGAPALSENKPGILSVASDDTRKWSVLFIPNASAASGYELNAALSVSGIGSDVKAGENSGRHLKHDFAVVALVNLPMAAGGKGYEGAFTMAKAPEGRLGLSVWITVPGHLEPVQAVGGWLGNSDTGK